jgi:hypothetical protein
MPRSWASVISSQRYPTQASVVHMHYTRSHGSCRASTLLLPQASRSWVVASLAALQGTYQHIPVGDVAGLRDWSTSLQIRARASAQMSKQPGRPATHNINDKAGRAKRSGPARRAATGKTFVYLPTIASLEHGTI